MSKTEWKVHQTTTEDEALRMAIMDEGGCVAWAVNRSTVDDKKNAHLISAAPELFDALVDADDLLRRAELSEDLQIELFNLYQKMHKAIQKARGEHV